MLQVSAIDHIVLTVRSVARSMTFYESVLGMRPVEFKPGRFALHFGQQKINLHEFGTAVDPNVLHATPGSADICFRTETLLFDAIKHLKMHGVPLVQGPVKAAGARAPLQSIYFHDPDANLIELSNES